MAVIDECDDHKKTADKDYVAEGYLAIRRRIISRFPGYGGLMMIGSPKTIDGFMMRMYRAANGDDNVLAFRCATWEALDPDEFSGPRFQAKDPDGYMHEIPVEYKKDWEKNPERFWRDLGAVPSYSIEPFITMPDRIAQCQSLTPVTWDGKGTLPDIRGNSAKEYIAHVDLGINKDGNDHCGIAIGHIAGSKEVMEFGGRFVERPQIYMDFIARLSAKGGDEIQISEVRRLLLYLKDRGFNYYRVQFDGWQSKDSQQILQKLGISVKQVSVDRDMYAYEALKEAIYDERVELGILEVPSEAPGESDNLIDIIVHELRTLRRVKGLKVDHPKGGSKDVADAIAGVVFGLTECKVLHKIGVRYTPNYIRDSFNIDSLNDTNKKYGSRAKIKAESSYAQKRGVPRIVPSTGIW
jgi:hypothetical protein